MLLGKYLLLRYCKVGMNEGKKEEKLLNFFNIYCLPKNFTSLLSLFGASFSPQRKNANERMVKEEKPLMNRS